MKIAKNIRLFGLMVLVTMIFISGASAKMICVDFENADMNPGETIEGIYWNDILMINATTADSVLVAENNSDIIAYNANDGSSKNVYPNGYLTGNGTCIDNTVLSEEEIFEFTFNDLILVNNFSLELFDFGDYNKFGSGYLNATLIAYNSSGDVVDSMSFEVSGASINPDNDAQYGPKTLTVEGLEISSVKLVTNPTEPFAIDNICFDAYCPPTNYPLFAGQDMKVGSVDVWNDCENLYVKYLIDEGYEDWYFTEAHIAVGDSLTDIPQTKKNNPIPGQFEYGNDSLHYVKEYTETIPMADCTDLVIATHAKVVEIGEAEMGVYSNTANEIMCENSTGGMEYAATPNYIGPNWPAAEFENGEWIWYPYPELTKPLPVEIVNFTHIFNIPTDAAHIEGSIKIACDDAYVLYLNDEYIGEDAVWSDVTYHELYPKAGLNELFITADNRGGGPAGLNYEIQINYLYEESDESAWGAEYEGEEQFDGKNWATYFIYTPCCICK